MNASHCINIFTNSFHRTSTNDKALPHPKNQQQQPIPQFALTKG